MKTRERGWEETVETAETQSHGDAQRRQRFVRFDGSACAAGRLAWADRIAKMNATQLDWALVFAIRSTHARRFATPVEPLLCGPPLLRFSAVTSVCSVISATLNTSDAGGIPEAGD